MLTKFLPLLVLGLCVFTVLSPASPANAITSLTQAEIQQLRNMVELIPKNKSQSQPARQLDTITPADGVCCIYWSSFPSGFMF
jgi:acrosin